MCKELLPISAPETPTRNRRQALLAMICLLAASPPFVARAGIAISDKLERAAPPLIEALQRRLTQLQMPVGPVNGRWTSQTEAAFAKFCRQRGLRITDRLTREHVRALWDEDFDLNDGEATLRFLRRIGVMY